MKRTHTAVPHNSIRIAKGKKWRTGGKSMVRNDVCMDYDYKNLTSDKAVAEVLKSLKNQGIVPTVSEIKDASGIKDAIVIEW